ncbi:MAG: S-layer homology domain-containing protein [Ruminiclostridium sp.]|nr:S-layer homology domain-containing protein [Ruminiclostridium sp.]
MLRTRKKVLALVLAMAMSLSLAVSAGAAFTDQDAVNYDVAVDTMVELGVINGYTDGSFKPANTVTRAEAAKMIAYTVAGADETTINYYDGATKFEDVTGSYAWASAAINYCAGKDIIAGRSETVFDPGASVTGAELTKMILVALGYEPETANKAETLVGANWMTNAISMGLKLDLYEGLNSDFVATQAANREETAQILFNALSANTKEVAFAIDDYYVYRDGEDLLEVAFGADAEPVNDDAGRPATLYSNFDNKDIDDITISEYADFTFTTAMEENDLFKALGAEGISGGVKYVVMDQIWEDGVQVAASEQIGTTIDYQAATGYNASFNDSVVIAKGDDSNIAGFGNGVVVEIFETEESNHYVMVAIREYIGTVTGVTKADEDKGTERTITIAGAGTFETEDFARQDVVLYTMDKNGVASVKAPTSISGTVTKITNGDTYTIDGVEYKLSQLNDLTPATDLALGTTGTWFVDSCGNLISLDETEEEDVYYGYLLSYEANTGASAGLLGNGSVNAGEKFEFVNDKGEVVVLDGAYGTDSDGDIDEFVASVIEVEDGEDIASISGTTWTDATANQLFAYELNGKGEISKVYNYTDAPSGNRTITKGDAFHSASSVALTSETVFFYVNDAEEEYAVYTGYANAPTKTGTMQRIFDSEDMVMNAVVLKVADVAAQSDEDYVYFAGVEKTVEETEDGDTVVTYTNVYVNGEKSSLKFEAVQSVEAGELYVFTTNTKTEMATLESEKTLGSTEITNIQATYFVAGTSIYTDADTIFYEIDEDNDTMTKEAMPALSTNDSYDVILMFVDGGADKDNAAKVVVFKVV